MCVCVGDRPSEILVRIHFNFSGSINCLPANCTNRFCFGVHFCNGATELAMKLILVFVCAFMCRRHEKMACPHSHIVLWIGFFSTKSRKNMQIVHFLFRMIKYKMKNKANNLPCIKAIIMETDRTGN